MAIAFRTTPLETGVRRRRGRTGSGDSGAGATIAERLVRAIACRVRTGADQLDAEGRAIIPPKLKPQVDQLDCQLQQLAPNEKESWLSAMAIMAGFDSDARSDRMREWHADRDASGLAHGNKDRLLFCRKRRDDGKLLLLPCPDQRAHARLFYELYRDGHTANGIVVYAAERSMRVPGTRRGYRRPRVSASIAAEGQIRILAREIQLADDHPQVLRVWMAETRLLDWNARCRLPKRSRML